VKKMVFVLVFVAAISFTATAQEMTAREYAKARGIPNRKSSTTLAAPHACTLSKQHPCIYYGGDINVNDPQSNALSNENDLTVPNIWTYTEVKFPVDAKITAAFTNNLQDVDVIDPKIANWDFRIGISEGNGGVSIASGTGPAQLTFTRNIVEVNEYELLTRTPVSVPKGNVWFDVQPNCTNSGDSECQQARYWESDTDGSLNAINGKFTQTSNTDIGPVLNSVFFGVNYGSWCIDEGVACGDGMSAGLLK